MEKIMAIEVEPENQDFSFYFDNDGFKSVSGDKKNAIYIFDRYDSCSYNEEEFNDFIDDADEILSAVTDINAEYGKTPLVERQKLVKTIQNIIGDCSAETAEKVADWAKEIVHQNDIEFSHHSYDGEFITPDDPKILAQYLSLINGAPYEKAECRGYSQGDYCEIVYCTETYTADDIKEIGGFWLGCGTEYSIDDCRGYYVPDNIRWQSGNVLANYLADAYGCKPEELEVLKFKETRSYSVYENLKGEEVDPHAPQATNGTKNGKLLQTERD